MNNKSIHGTTNLKALHTINFVKNSSVNDGHLLLPRDSENSEGKHGHERYGEDGIVFHKDTIILISSMIIMILVGKLVFSTLYKYSFLESKAFARVSCIVIFISALICYAILSYLTKIKKRRRMYQRGLLNAGNQTLNITRKISMTTKMDETTLSKNHCQ